jgi:hypothetical protein
VPFSQGGFFIITLMSATPVYYLAAPEVVPTDGVTLARPRGRATSDADRAAARRYGEVAHPGPRPPFHFGAR